MACLGRTETGSWRKFCIGECSRIFEVKADNFLDAVKAMRKHFGVAGSSNGARDGLHGRCHSCKGNQKQLRHGSEHRDTTLEAQGGKCALCPKTISFGNKTAVVDHCHVSGAIRGVLCVACNAYGMSYIDNDEWLSKAIAYRDKYKNNS